MYSPSVFFFKDRLKLYIFESLKWKFEFENNFWMALNLDINWVKMAATHFVTQFTHVSRHFGVYSNKQKKMI